MSFGQRQYQHRFFNIESHKKPALYTPSNNNILPILSTLSPPIQAKTYQNIFQHAQPSYLRTVQQPRIRMKSEPTTDPYGGQYKNNADILERFRRQAQTYKHRQRYRHLKRYEEEPSEQPQPQQSQTFKTQAVYLEPQPAQDNSRIVYNPQLILVSKQDYQLHKQYEKQRNFMMSRMERESTDSRVKLKEYKRKYNRLKNKLKEEVRLREEEERIKELVKEKDKIDKEKNRLAQIRDIMNNISDHLQKNSQLLDQSIKLSNHFSLQNSPAPSKKQSKASHLPPLSSSFTQYTDEEPPRSPPTIIYAKKHLDSQYEHMERVKKNIEELNYRLKKMSH